MEVLHTIRIKSDSKNLADLREELERLFMSHHAVSDLVMKLLIAIDEAASNIINHAYKSPSDDEIEISIRITDEAVEISLKDTGEPYLSPKKNTRTLDQKIKSGDKRGYGLHLIERIMDKVERKHLDDTGENVITCLKYIRSEAAGRN
ncbi:MAG: ATP-binding protein [Planctomycetes bacterium]|nr:ATP-binding protein [Planctomycetota bacterium]